MTAWQPGTPQLTEFDIKMMALIMEHYGEVLTQEHINEAIWTADLAIMIMIKRGITDEAQRPYNDRGADRNHGIY